MDTIWICYHNHLPRIAVSIYIILRGKKVKRGKVSDEEDLLEGTLTIFATLLWIKIMKPAWGQSNKDKNRWVCKLKYIHQKLWLMPALSILWPSVALTSSSKPPRVVDPPLPCSLKCIALLCFVLFYVVLVVALRLATSRWKPRRHERESAFDVTLDNVAICWLTWTLQSLWVTTCPQY